MIQQTLISTKYQVVIPKDIRRKLKLRPGQRLNVNQMKGRIILTPQKKWPEVYLRELKGLLKIGDVRAYVENERGSWGLE